MSGRGRGPLVAVLGLAIHTPPALAADDGRGLVDWDFGARLQMDLTRFRDTAEIPFEDGPHLRRFRLTAEVARADWAAKLAYDFSYGGREGVRDVYLRYSGIERSQLTVGHFKEPFGMERKTSVRDLPFMERSILSVLAPSRHAGIEYLRTGEGWTAAAGVFGRGAEDNGTNTGHA